MGALLRVPLDWLRTSVPVGRGARGAERSRRWDAALVCLERVGPI